MQSLDFKSMKSCKRSFLFLSTPQQQLTAAKAMLAEQFSLRELSSLPFRRIFFDSFDWRLYQKKMICFWEEGYLHLLDFSGDSIAAPLLLPDAPPRFWQDLPDAPLRQCLANMLQMRALLPQAELSGTVTRLQLLEQHEEQEERFALALLTEAGSYSNTLCLLELRADKKQRKQFRKLSRQLKCFSAVCPLPLKQQFQTALAAAGRSIEECEPTAPFALEPDMDSRSAAKLICRSLLTVMQRNQQGVIDDIDTEFLHDFRVAMRRTRSLLSLMKNALEPEIRDRFKEEFRILGQITGPVRDLDVQLLSQEECRESLPESLHLGLERFFAGLREARAAAQAVLAAHLAAPECQAMLQDWQEHLESQENDEQNGDAVAQTARKIIRKQFVRMLREVQALDGQSTDDEVHQVRIHGKKLRYALEFFRSLYPAEDMARLITALKQLQDRLGLWNDLSVQEEMLEQHIAQLEADSPDNMQIAAAVGGLLTDVDRRRLEARQGLEAAFQQFTSKKNVQRWQRLFGKVAA
jgi:CHAD domain-containing protein